MEISFPKIKNVLLVILLVQQSLQFHKFGHMVVARIAELELEDTRIYSQMMDILNIITGYTKERKYPFIETAPWADDIKALGVKSMSKWHFSDHYINGKRKLTEDEKAEHNIIDDPQNLVWAINQAHKVLKNQTESLIDDRLNKSIYLRMLIHLYGDLHQPLHNVSLVDDKDFKKGDAGGNKFEIDMPGARNLHSLWDMCLKNCKEVSVPLKEKDFDLIDTYAKELMKKHPRKLKWVQKRLEVSSIKEMSDESIPMAIKTVYAGLKPGKKVTEKYLKKGRDLVDKQLLIAGYRLSDALQNLFEDENVLKPHIKTEKFNYFEDEMEVIQAMMI
jgi:hypothetical protein